MTEHCRSLRKLTTLLVTNGGYKTLLNSMNDVQIIKQSVIIIRVTTYRDMVRTQFWEDEGVGRDLRTLA